jgi:hypothetical protein
LLGIYAKNQHDVSFCANLRHLPKIFPSHDDVMTVARMVRAECHALATNDSSSVVIMVPESSLYAWQLCNDAAAVSLLVAREAHATLDCIIGSFYDDNGFYRNSLYWIKDGTMQKRYDKRHAMVLIERLPVWLRCSLLKTIFFKSMPEIVPSSNEHPLIVVGGQQLVCYICSELFFNHYPDDPYGKIPILVLINDRWCSAYYMKLLMKLGAKIRALQWQRPIIYVAYSEMAYL